MPPHEVTGMWGTLTAYERPLWGVVVLAMLADVLLTYYGVERGLVEGNPVARAGLERFGYAALGALKLFALAIALAGRAVLPTGYTAIVPLALAIPWTIASLINAALIATI